MEILEAELQRDISDEERREIREKIFKLIMDAREETAEQRKSNRWYAKLAATVVLVGLGMWKILSRRV